MKTPHDIEALCKKLKPIIGDKATALWYSYLSANHLERKDLELDIEIIAERLLKSQPLSQPEILLNPPAQEESTGSFLVGDVLYKGQTLHSLYLRPEDYIKQIGIFAITGEGKTNLAYLLALQLLKAKIPFLVIDWKRSWRNLLSLRDEIPELKDLRVFTIGREVIPFLWNPFRAPPGSDHEQWISTVAEVLEKSHLSGPGVAYFITRIFPKLFQRAKKEFYPNFFDGVRELEKTSARERELRWKQTAMRIFQTFTIGNGARAFNSRNPIPLEALLDGPVILELDLELPKPLRIFFSEILLRWLHLYRLQQGETKNLRHVLFLEEAHNLFSRSHIFDHTPSTLENVYREIRAFGQGLVTITQHPSLLPVYLLGNCHTQIYLGLQHADDISTARKALFLSRDEEEYLNKLEVGQAIVKVKNRVNPCLVKIPLIRLNSTPITDRQLRVNTPAHLPHPYDDKSPVNPSYLPAHKKKTNSIGKNGKYHSTTPDRIQLSFLLDILENPLSSTIQRYKRLALNPKYGNLRKNRLIGSGFVQAKKLVTKIGRLTLFELTYKGRTYLRDCGHEVKEPREGVVHLFWKEKIAGYYRHQGYEVLVEQPINGRPDIIAKKDGKKIAVEIETGKSDFIGNIQRALKAGFDIVVCVATNMHVEERIKKELNSKAILDDRLIIASALDMNIFS